MGFLESDKRDGTQWTYPVAVRLGPYANAMQSARVSVLLVDDFQYLARVKNPAERRRWVLRLEHNRNLARTDETPSQLVAVSGEIYSTIIERVSPRAFFCVSIPGIDFATSDTDRKAFLESRRLEWHVNSDGLLRMRRIWHHALLCFQEGHVQSPVLCALGSNDKRVKNIPLQWADMLAGRR